MSSQKVKKITHRLAYTSTYATGVLTVTTASAHLLVTGDVVTLTNKNVPQEVIGAVTVTGANTFTIADARTIDFTSGEVVMSHFNAGFTGRVIFTLPRSTAAASVVQSFATGTGGAAYTLDGSLDGIHWTNIASITHGLTTGDTQSATITANWAYLSMNITSVGAATSLTSMLSA